MSTASSYRRAVAQCCLLAAGIRSYQVHRTKRDVMSDYSARQGARNACGRLLFAVLLQLITFGVDVQGQSKCQVLYQYLPSPTYGESFTPCSLAKLHGL